MKLNAKATAVSLGVLSAVAVLIAGLGNLVWPGYAGAFLKTLASLYPGYTASGTFGDLATGMLYALVDGGLFGLVFAWFYNLVALKAPTDAPEVKRDGVINYPPIEPHA